MRHLPLSVMKFAVGVLAPAAIMLWLVLEIVGVGALKDAFSVIQCMKEPEPQACFHERRYHQ